MGSAPAAAPSPAASAQAASGPFASVAAARAAAAARRAAQWAERGAAPPLPPLGSDTTASVDGGDGGGVQRNPHLHGGRASNASRLRRTDYLQEKLDTMRVQLREAQAAVNTQQTTQQSQGNNHFAAGTNVLLLEHDRSMCGRRKVCGAAPAFKLRANEVRNRGGAQVRRALGGGQPNLEGPALGAPLVQQPSAKVVRVWHHALVAT